MEDKKFEKQKLDKNDYQGEEKKIGFWKTVGGIAVTVGLAVLAIFLPNHNGPSSKA